MHNAISWLLEGPPSQISSKTLNGFHQYKASEMHLARTMSLQPRTFFKAALPARMPPEVAARLAPLMDSLADRHLVGKQDEPLLGLFELGFSAEEMEDEEEMRREVMISSLTLASARDGDKLHVLFFRQTTNYMCTGGTVTAKMSPHLFFSSKPPY